MTWLLAWLILNATVLVWRVLVAFPQVSAEGHLSKAPVSVAVDRA